MAKSRKDPSEFILTLLAASLEHDTRSTDEEPSGDRFVYPGIAFMSILTIIIYLLRLK
jgi:hypothetical protein